MAEQLWGGRFSKSTDEMINDFQASIDFDKRMYNEDIAGSIAHATMLAKVGIISEADRDDIISGLKDIYKKIEEGNFSFEVALEDIHMNIEKRLTDAIGEAGGRLHTARSRNDQVALDTHMFIRRQVVEVEKLILTRPAVEAGEKLGFLPGDLQEKVDPYLRPLYDALQDILGQDVFAKLMTKGVIEVAPLAYMRGRTLENAFVILDEAQNTTDKQMKMFLTRLGFGSRMVVTGDPGQIDLPRGVTSGLVEATKILDGVKGIGVVRLEAMDVIRHDVVTRIVQAYDAYEQKQKIEQKKEIAINNKRKGETE